MSPWRIFRIVFGKELRELLRDRKTLFWLFAPPIILPAIALLAAGFIGSQTARYITNGFPIVVVNGEAAPGLMESLRRSGTLIVGQTHDVNTLITLSVPADFEKNLAAGQAAHLTLTQRDNTYASTLALGAVRSEIAAYNDLLLGQRLKQIGQDRTWLTPVIVDETKVAAAAASVTAPVASSGNAATNGLGAIFLPLAVTSWLVGGGLGLIVDTTVGEKERQTIETVLVTPASRIGIVVGKLGVVFLASLFVMSLWMVEGVFLSLVAEMGPQLLAAQGGVDIAALLNKNLGGIGSLVLMLLLLLLPFIVLLNSLVMTFCSFASSYRESNTFLFLLQLILPAMVLLSIFSIGPDAGSGWYAAPLLGTIIAIRDLFSQTLTAGNMTLAGLSTSVYALLALVFASYTYSREWALTRGV